MGQLGALVWHSSTPGTESRRIGVRQSCTLMHDAWGVCLMLLVLISYNYMLFVTNRKNTSDVSGI